MSCTTEGCPSGKRCFQIAFNEFKCVNTTTPRGGKVLEPNQTIARAYATLDQMINEAITGGQKKKKSGELDRLIDKADDGKKKKNKRGGDQKDDDDDDDDETEIIMMIDGKKVKLKKSDLLEDDDGDTILPIVNTTGTTTQTPATGVTPPPAAATVPAAGGSTKIMEWIKANPPFAIIIAGLVLYIVMRGGR